MDFSFWIAQVFGLIGAVGNVVSMQINNKRKILFFYAVANFSYAINFFLLGAFTGSALCLIQAITTVINGMLDEKNIKIQKWLIGIYLLLVLAIGFYTYSGIIDVLAIMGGILYALIITSSKESRIRKLTFLSMIGWTIYDFCVKSYVAGTNDLLMLISTSIGIYRFDIKKNN